MIRFLVAILFFAMTLVPSVAFAAPGDMLTVGVELTQESWNTFRFIADTNQNGDVGVEWSFGDGATARGHDVVHTFGFSGDYVVSAVATNPEGARAQEKVELAISFWHLGNWQLWVILVALMSMTAFLLLLTRERDAHTRYVFDVSESDERSIAPVLLAAEEMKKELEEEGEKPKRKSTRKRTAAKKKTTTKKVPQKKTTTKRKGAK